MAERIGWDKFEVALLIDACNQVLKGNAVKSAKVSELSAALRKRAENNGVKIDEIFRNENGISLQITKMNYLLTGGKVGLPGASKLYAEIAELSKSHPADFTNLLVEAQKQIGIKGAKANMSIKEQFSQWLSTNPSQKYKPDAIIKALDEGSDYCRAHGISKECFWEITEKEKFTSITTKLLSMRIYRLIHRNTALTLDKAVPLYKRFLAATRAENVTPQIEARAGTIAAVEANPVVIGPETPGEATPIHPEENRAKIYQKLYSISKVYDDPEGLSIKKIMSMLGNGVDEQLARTILEDASWATKLSDDVYSFSEKVPIVLREPLSSYETTLAHITDTTFFDYLRKQVGMAEATCRSYVSAIRTAEKFAQDHHYIPGRLYDSSPSDAMKLMRELLSDATFLTFDARHYKRISAAFAKLSDMASQSLSGKSVPELAAQPKTKLENFDKEKFENTLLRRYRSGMQFDSIDFENFRKEYDMLYDEELPFDDAALEERLRYCGVIYKDRLFPAEGIIDNDTKEKLFAYIDSSFSSGKKVLYYKAILDDLADVFASCFTLSDENMLKAYIEYTAEIDKYHFFSDYMATEKYVIVDHNAEVSQVLLNAGKPMTTDDICAALSHIPQDQIRKIVANDGRFLRNAKGEYFHTDIFEVSDSELEYIDGIISGFINENEYAIWTDVWNGIQNQLPAFVENNLYLSGLGIRNALAQHFVGSFNFEGAVISMPEDHFAMRDVYQLYAKHHAEFTADDIYGLSKELDTVIYFDALLGVSVRVSHDLFVSKARIEFDADAIDKTIGSFMAKDYIQIREINSFLAFPNVSYEWNEYLLESYLLSYSKKFILLNNGLALNNVAGVIAKRNGEIMAFVDACAAVLADSGIELKKAGALDYLAKVHVITRRSYRDLDTALRKAKQLRARKG